MLRLYNPRPPEPRVNWKWTAGILSAHAVVLLALVGLATINPKISTWIFQAVEAELAAYVPPSEIPKTQLAQPNGAIRSIRFSDRLYR
jgi:hypothetical protein